VIFDLRRHGARPALLTAEAVVTYEDLADRADALLGRIGDERRLILLRGGSGGTSGSRGTVDLIVALCAAFQGNHPVIVAPPERAGRPDELEATYRPDVIIDTDSGRFEVRAGASAHSLHPDLALLMSTSGSTGSPKLVRLSRTAVRANAAAITSYLQLTQRDRALLTLPLHYCYGLSVLTSHLYAGGAVVVTDYSVLDACLWDLAEKHAVTGFAGVPYTFDQLDQAGFPEVASLRYVTQAGGKLPADRVSEFIELGQRRGWDFFVMYGQTEATARMAYLPPELAEDHPGAVGLAVPGGALRVDCPNDKGVGEIVYAGPNVMMGYAERPADLSRGHDLAELRTGDLGREVEPGLFEVVGRRNRFAKVFGLRLDLEQIERRVPCAAVEIDGVLGIVSPLPDAADSVAALCDLPLWSVHSAVADVPRTSTGKPDYAATKELLRERLTADEHTDDTDLCSLYASLLRRERVHPGDSFVSLGADSLSYVELSVRLGDLLDPLPRDWHRRTIAELSQLQRTKPAGRAATRRVQVEPTVLLRSLAIILIVGTHANLWTVPGGAHALLAVCGYNAARFLPAGRRAATRLAGAAGAIAIPSMIWIGTMSALGIYAPTSAFFLNGLLGADHWTIEWQFWFLEAAIWTMLGLAALFSIRWVRRIDEMRPFGTAVAFLAGAAVLRYALVGVDAGPTERYSLPIVLWCFALGWAAAKAQTFSHRFVVAMAGAALVVGFFGDPRREAIIAGSVVFLLWARPLPLPRPLAYGCAALATASLSIYLTHWQIYPHLEMRYPLAATVLSLLVGVTYHRVYSVISGRVGRLVRIAFGRVRMALNVDRRVEGRADQHRDRQDVEPQQHRDRSRQWAVDRRPAARGAQHGADAVAAHDPHEQRESSTGDPRAPRLPDGDGQVVQGRHEPDRQDEHSRPVPAA
jgi:acyl-CoA synthetase (AMP-forming)/AMP-acid ligase II